MCVCVCVCALVCVCVCESAKVSSIRHTVDKKSLTTDPTWIVTEYTNLINYSSVDETGNKLLIARVG